MQEENLLYADITFKIIGCAMKVHTELGNGFQEIIYQRALEKELEKSGLNFTKEFQMPIYYKDEPIGKRRVDFFVENKIPVELKAIINLENAQLAQALNYLESYKVPTGLLINFGAKSLQYRRLINNKVKNDPKNP
jgi:GxxExxY protein